eukprot:TRINITY_DN3280_c0_g1_i1.p1 TRINITY_DN3280_c0_g1~~TRINITY_DN3280_c0_g1_i1.p1  ORF type:complete len:823 (+),score=205.25 TRINITY_DN3280_c0_g1_i1:70-2469(+)
MHPRARTRREAGRGRPAGALRALLPLLAAPPASAYQCANMTQGKCSVEGLESLGTAPTEKDCIEACKARMWLIRLPVCCSYNSPYLSDCAYNPEVLAPVWTASLVRVAVQCTEPTATSTGSATISMTLPTTTGSETATLTATATATATVTLPTGTVTSTATFTLPTGTVTATDTVTLPTATATLSATVTATQTDTASLTRTATMTDTITMPTTSATTTLTVTLPSSTQTSTVTLPTATATVTLPSATRTDTVSQTTTQTTSSSETLSVPTDTPSTTESLPTATLSTTFAAPLHLFTKVKSGYQCLSDNVDFGTVTTVEQCAEQCAFRPLCQYFIFGEPTGTWGNKEGQCKWETTTSESCTEGWWSDSFSFYKLTRERDECPDGAGSWQRLPVAGATLSSVYKEADGTPCTALNCVDGGEPGQTKAGQQLNYGEPPANGTVCDNYCKTLWQSNPWLRLDFALPITVTSVRIWNRDEYGPPDDLADDQHVGAQYLGVTALDSPTNETGVTMLYHGDRLAPEYQVQVAADPAAGRTEQWAGRDWVTCANRSVAAGGNARTARGPFHDRCTASDVRSVRIRLPGAVRQLNLLEVEVFGCPGNWTRPLPWRGSSESHHGAVSWKQHHNRVDRSRDTGYCGVRHMDEACQVPVGTECSGAFVRDWDIGGEGIFHICGGHGTCLVIGGDDFGGQWRPIECSGKYCGGYYDPQACAADERCHWDTSLDTPACAETQCGPGRLPTQTCVCDSGYELRFVGSRHVSCAQTAVMPGFPGYQAYRAGGAADGLPGYRSVPDANSGYPFGAG